MNHQDRDPEELLTLLREKEGKLQKTLEELSYLKSIVQNSEDAIIGIDLDGTIISWNPGAEKIHGFTASEAIGNSVSMLIPPYNTNEISLILAWIKSGERVDHYETLRRRKDGTLVDISLSISPVRDQDGEVVSVSTIARDITHHKKMELKGEGEGRLFTCSCGFREKLSSFSKRMDEKTESSDKRTVQKYLQQQKKEEPINSAMAEALAKWKEMHDK